MDGKNQMSDKLKIKSELTNARVKKYRKKKCTESQQFFDTGRPYRGNAKQES